MPFPISGGKAFCWRLLFYPLTYQLKGGTDNQENALSRRIVLCLTLVMLLLAGCGTSPGATPTGVGSRESTRAPSAATLQAETTGQAIDAESTPASGTGTITTLPTGATTPSPGLGATATSARPAATGIAAPTTQAARYPLTHIDAGGVKVALEKRPERIVSLYPTNNDTLFSIGAGDQVIAVDKEFTTWPEEAREKQRVECNYTSCNVEKIVALKPDLVLTSTGTEELADKPLRDAGVKVISTPYPATLADTYRLMRDLGRITGHEQEAEREVTELQRAVEDVRQRTSGAPKVRVYFESDATTPGKPYTYGPGSLGHELVTIAGGQNVFAAGKTSFPQVSFESIVRADPQVILLANVKGYVGPNIFGPITVEEVKQRQGFNTIRAVRDNRLAPVYSDLLSPGPRLADGIRDIAVAIHPEIFGER